MRERLMLDVPLPEILRSKLESVILNLKLLHVMNPYEFLKTLISVPDERAVNHGLSLLKRFVFIYHCFKDFSKKLYFFKFLALKP